MFSADRKGAFSNEGFRVRRLNPDNSYPTPERQLGFLGTIDVSSVSGKLDLFYRIDGKGTFTKLEVDISTGTYVSKPAATVAEVVAAMNADTAFKALFEAEADVATTRLNLKLKTVTSEVYLEFKGPMANLLGLGQSGDAPAMGTAFVDCFDNSGAISFPKNIKDFEEIDKESGTGNIDTMVIDAQLVGINPSIALTEELYELKVMIQGGDWNEDTTTYTPPTSDQSVLPTVACEAFVAKYGKGVSHRGDLTGYKMYDIKRMVGRESDVSHEVKSWADYQFECRVGEFEENGKMTPGWVERELTIPQFKTLIG